jgi:hypothetical protein
MLKFAAGCVGCTWNIAKYNCSASAVRPAFCASMAFYKACVKLNFIEAVRCSWVFLQFIQYHLITTAKKINTLMINRQHLADYPDNHPNRRL